MSSEKRSVLIVEDSPTQRLSIRVLLEKAGYQVEEAGNGCHALECLRERQPEIVLTDLQMPELDGLGLVRRLNQDFPSLPVVLMTGKGSEEIAVAALRSGAASYVTKDEPARKLLDTLDRVISTSRRAHRFTDVLEYVDQCSFSFVLGNERPVVLSCVQYMQSLVERHCFQDPADIRQFGVAIEEALLNALYHSNLELPETIHELEAEERNALASSRRKEGPYANRRIFASIKVSSEQVEVVVRDEGLGFQQQRFQDLIKRKDTSFIVAEGLRGLLLIHTFMDTVDFNDSGTEITMIKHSKPESHTARAVEFDPVEI